MVSVFCVWVTVGAGCKVEYLCVCVGVGVRGCVGVWGVWVGGGGGRGDAKRNLGRIRLRFKPPFNNVYFYQPESVCFTFLHKFRKILTISNFKR